jgi:hypothetical protein
MEPSCSVKNLPTRHKAGLVGPAYFLVELARSILVQLADPECRFLKTHKAAPASELHHHRKVLQFVLQHGHGAPGHLDAASRIERRFGRDAIAAPHQKHLQ